MTLLEYWTLFCWLGWWLVWIAAWLFTKRTAWQQPVKNRLLYSILLWLAFVFEYLSLAHRGTSLNIVVLPQIAGVVWLGFFLTLFGALFAIAARFTLGSNWSRSMDLKEGHQLVARGPYALVRHPIYTGVILMCIGSALVAGTLLGLVGILLAIWSCMIRIPQEEALMTQQFPNEYPLYAKRVKRLAPLIY